MYRIAEGVVQPFHLVADATQLQHEGVGKCLHRRPLLVLAAGLHPELVAHAVAQARQRAAAKLQYLKQAGHLGVIAAVGPDRGDLGGVRKVRVHHEL